MRGSKRTKSKRKNTPQSRSSTAKKQREQNEHENGAGNASSSALDQLCDNTLLRIISYADLRSLINITKCTCKSLRNRFDPADVSSANQCSKIWPQVFKDLHMCPLDEADKSLDYADAIGYRLSMYQTLIASGRRAAAKSKMLARRSCFSLPTKHHYFMPLTDGWRLQVDDDTREDFPLVDPFALLSGGTGTEYVYIDPVDYSLELHFNIMEKAICLDKTIQKRIKANPNYAGLSSLADTLKVQSYHEYDSEKDSTKILYRNTYPHQVLLTSIYYSVDNGDMPLDNCWDEYFGEGTPFGVGIDTNNHSNEGNQHEIDIDGAMVASFDTMSEDGIHLIEKNITLMRMIRDKQNENNFCIELILWSGNRGCNGNWKKFMRKSIIRVSAEWQSADICSQGTNLYATFDDCTRIPGESHPRPEDAKRAVFHFQLKDVKGYCEPEGFFLVCDDISCILALAKNIVMVGTQNGMVEIWDSTSHEGFTPHCVHSLCQVQDSFSNDVPDLSPNAITCMHEIGASSLKYGFATVQECRLHGADKDGTVISFWEAIDVCTEDQFDVRKTEFRVTTKLKYKCFPEIAWSGKSVSVLGYDKFGSLFLDIYHLRASKLSSFDADQVNIPKDVDMDFLTGQNQIQFANRINIGHRIDIDNLDEGLGIPERVVLDQNDRFITVSVNDGMVGGNGTQKAGPGFIVIDLDEHESSSF